MTIAAGGEGTGTPWTIADVAKAIVFVVVVTVLIFGSLLLLRLFVLSGEVVSILALVGAFLAELAMFMAAWLFGVRKYRVPWSALGFRPFQPVVGFALVGFVLLASFVVNIIYVQIISVLGLDWLRPPPVLPPFLTGIWRLIVPLVLAGGIAPIAEETFFRGFVFPALQRRFGLGLAATGSAVLFTLAHIQPSVLVPIFVLGLLLVWLYYRTNSIWPCVSLHFVYNSLAVIVAYSVDISRSGT